MELSPLEHLRERIEHHTGPGRRAGTGWQLKCPAHDDRSPSLSLTENAEHHALMCCQAGCANVDILTAVGLTLRDLYPLRDNRQTDPVIATYRYVDQTGVLLFEVQRTAGKRFRQRRPDPFDRTKWVYNLDGVQRVLYRLPHVLEAVRDGRTVYVVEGEKDVESLERYGEVATTNPGGAGKWRPEYNEWLRGAHVILVADRDPQGQGLKHARQVHQELSGVADLITLTQPAVGKDITDHLVSGLGVDDVVTIGPEIAPPPPEPAPVAPEPADDPAETPTDTPANPLRLTRASSFKIKPVRWAWEGRMPLGEITLIPGREGVGKSTFLAWMAAAVTNGNLPGEFHGQPRAVFYSASEDAWTYTIAPRMVAAGANMDLIYRLDVVEDEGPERLTLPTHCRWLPEMAQQEKAAMLMCDPIMSLVHDSINTNRAQELRRALEPLRHAAEQGGFSVAALVHFNKTRDSDLLSAVSGSRAWVEVARAVIAIAKDTDAGHNVVSQSKNNLGMTDLPNLTYTIISVDVPTDEDKPAKVGRLQWGDDTDSSAEEVIQRKPSHTTTANVANTTQAVLDYLDEQGWAVSPRQLADALPDLLNHDNARKILSRLASTGQIERVGTGLYKASSRKPEKS